MIGTRPDCLPPEVLNLLAEYNKHTLVWLEIGLQSTCNQTLACLNRAHTAEQYFAAAQQARLLGLRVSTHIIFGLPGESQAQMLSTVARLASLPPDGIKIHQLCIYKGSALEAAYRAGHIKVLDENTYVCLVATALEMLPAEVVVMRLVGEGPPDEIIAPEWAWDKDKTIAAIDDELAQRAGKQGSAYKKLIQTVKPHQ